MATAVLAPFYVPRPPYAAVWQGVPSSSSIALQLIRGLVPSVEWRYDLVPDPNWLGISDANTLIRDLQTPKMFGAPGQSPTKFWRYDLVPQPDWLGKPIGANTKLLAQSFDLRLVYKPWNFNIVPSPNWVGEGIAPNFNLLKSFDPRLFNKALEFYVPESMGWTWKAPPSFLVTLLAPGPTPTLPKQTVFNLQPDPVWTWEAPPALTMYLGGSNQTPTIPKQWFINYPTDSVWLGKSSSSQYLPTSAGLTNTLVPSILWQYDHVPARNWQGTPISAKTLGFPVAGTPIIPGRWKLNLQPDPVWTWEAFPAYPPLLALSVVQPNPVQPPVEVPYPSFDPQIWSWRPPSTYLVNPPSVVQQNLMPPAILWRYDYVPDPIKNWVPGAPPKAQVPNPFFSKAWHYDYIPSPDWGTKSNRYSQTIPPPPNPFFSKAWHYDYVPERFWSWGGTTRPKFPATVTFYGAQGQAPTKQWHYDYHINAPLWLGKPYRYFNIFAARPPHKHVDEDIGRPFRRERRRITKQILPIFGRFKS